jgi:ABC-type Na+ efflux pump permease subunit
MFTTTQKDQLRMQIKATIEAYRIVEEKTEKVIDSLLVALTSRRAIAGYKALYSILAIIGLCIVYAALWLKQELLTDPRNKPPIVGELVIPKRVSIPVMEQPEPTRVESILASLVTRLETEELQTITPDKFMEIAEFLLRLPPLCNDLQ